MIGLTHLTMNKEFWDDYYAKNKITEPSTFALFVEEDITGPVVDIGCGDGRDVFYFKRKGKQVHGVDESNEDVGIIKQDIMSYIDQNESPEHVYARFFWHAIDRNEQLAILKWVKKHLYLEARTDKDKPKNIIGSHKRNLVDTTQLKKDLEDNGFEVTYFVESYGLSPFRGEDPHLFRVIAKKK